MKPTNEQLLAQFGALQAAMYASAYTLESGSSVDEWAKIAMNEFIEYAATLPDELETGSLQLDDHIVDANKKVDAPQFEVGGTCDQGRIIHIEPSGLHVLVGADGRVVFGTEITNYKPPVRVKAWLMNFGTDGMPTLLDQPGAVASYVNNGYTAQAGYWTPEVWS